MVVVSSCRREATGPGDDPTNYPVESTFSGDASGWTAAGDGILYYSPTAGNPASSGYVFIIDQTQGDNFYFAAPERFLGNASGSYGRLLEFDLVWSETSPGNHKVGDDVVLRGGGRTLVATLPQPPTTSWTSYSIPLDPTGNWVHQDGGAAATAAEIQETLGSLERLWIRGEFRHGAEQGGLDNVRFGAAP